MLWRVAFMFQGKRMERIMAFLAEEGVLNLEGPQPAIEVSNRPPLEVLAEKIAGHKLVRKNEIEAWVQDLGRGSTAYYVKAMQRAGMIRPSGTRGLYEVVARSSATKKKRK